MSDPPPFRSHHPAALPQAARVAAAARPPLTETAVAISVWTGDASFAK